MLGILRIDDDAADLAGVAQADVGPGLAAVSGFVDAVAGGQIGANVRFARARVNDLRIGRRHCERADRSHRLPIEDRLPNHAGIGGFPDAAIDGAEVKGGRVAGNSGHRDHAASAKWPDQSPLESAVKFGGNRLRSGRRQNDQRD